MSKAVVLLSGGIDSSTLLYKMVDSGYDCYPLTISYGQRHQKEILAARNISEALGIVKDWEYVDLSILRTLLPSSLTGVGDIPEGHYADESMKSTVVPNRNMILLSVAAGYAQGLGADTVAYAPHMGDHAIYPDCRPEFVESVKKTIKLGTGWTIDEGIHLKTPFVSMTKADIVKLGSSFYSPPLFYEDTWSCYKGGKLHCGLCGTCVERKEAFKLAGVHDPTKYES